MAVSGKMYGNAILKAFNKDVDWDTDIIKVALLASAYTPNQDTDILWSAISSNEVTGVGYTVGGATLASKTIAYDNATNVIKMDSADVTWATSTITARYAVIYDSTSGILLGYVDLGVNESSSAGNFTLVWDANGIFTVTVT